MPPNWRTNELASLYGCAPLMISMWLCLFRNAWGVEGGPEWLQQVTVEDFTAAAVRARAEVGHAPSPKQVIVAALGVALR